MKTCKSLKHGNVMTSCVEYTQTRENCSKLTFNMDCNYSDHLLLSASTVLIELCYACSQNVASVQTESTSSGVVALSSPPSLCRHIKRGLNTEINQVNLYTGKLSFHWTLDSSCWLHLIMAVVKLISFFKRSCSTTITIKRLSYLCFYVFIYWTNCDISYIG